MFNNYQFRCSAIGNIVTDSGKLTVGAKTYLKEAFIGEIHGVKKEAYGKALDKGVACEEDGFKMLNDVIYPGRFVAKEKEPRSNEWIKGTADCILDGCVTDIKNAWDRFTFGKAELSHIYESQLRGYMFLYGVDKARLFYCLSNLPEHMILDEERKLFYTQKKWLTMEDPDFEVACKELREAHNYDAMQIWERFKTWDLYRDIKWEEKMKDCISQARAYMEGLLKDHNEMIDFNKSLTTKAIIDHA